MSTGRKISSWGVFSGGNIFVIVVLLAIIIPVVGRVVSAVFAQADGRLTLLSATAAKSESTNRPDLSESGEWETVRMRVTAYCACKKCCGKYADGITACGHKIRPGDAFVAADNKYSFGTEMIVPGYNNGWPIKVLDRGGAIRGNRLDVFFHSHKKARRWGVKYIDVKVRRNSETL